MTATVALLCIALGLFGAGGLLGWWFRGALEHDDLVALDRARRSRQRLAKVYAWPEDHGGAA